MQVTPHDVASRVMIEFPQVAVRLTDIQGLDATFHFDGEDVKLMRAARKRASELAKKAGLFNAHYNLGHCQRKTNWWKR